MPKLFKYFSFVLFIVLFPFLAIRPAQALTLAQQTQNYTNQLKVFQVVQELGDNLSGTAGKFTFRVSTSQPNDIQFDHTALNSKIYDKTTNNVVIPFGCVTNSSDPLNGLTFQTQGVPAGYQDVTIDFSCHNYSFIPGHRYLIKITNANMGNEVWAKILFGAAAYGSTINDYFTGGGLRYGNANIYDYANNSGSCDPVAYRWGGTDPWRNGCYVWTTPRDDLYFILSDTTPDPTPTPILTPTPTPTPTPSPTPIPKTPLILIPGIGGSELKVEEETQWIDKDDGHGGKFNYIYPEDEKVWVNEGEAIKPGNDDYFDVLRMQNDGINSEANIEIGGSLVMRAYGETVSFFTSNGYELNKDFFVFPYDWRLDNALHINKLSNRIQEIKTQTGNEKVDIIAHSMGGLIARAYISDSARAQNVRKLFTLGTPHLGAPKFLQAIRYGICLVEIGPLCPILAISEVNDVLQNLISGYQLAPSQAYFNFYTDADNSHPYPYRTESGSLNYSQIKNLLDSLNHNTSLFTQAETFHSIDNSLAIINNVDIINIAGSGQPTIGQIIELKTLSLSGAEDTKKNLRIINGDNTVPLFSASLDDPASNLSLLGSANLNYTNQTHDDLVINGPALNLVKNILENIDQLPDGVSTQPYPLPLIYRIFSVHSPVNIHAYDTNGNHTGPTPDGAFEVNIPGSSYDTLGDAKFIYLPNDGVYNIKFEATDNGSFDFKIREFENDENTETILYKEIPLTDNTKAETIFDTSSTQPPIISVDQDGNGITDSRVENFSILEGDANYDYTPPVVSFDVNPKTIWPPNNKMVDVNITGTISDDNPYLTKIIVEDEYDLVEPTATIQNQTTINQAIELEASRKGDDIDGRKYTVKILVTDLAGNTSLSTIEVVVPHDQGKKK